MSWLASSDSPAAPTILLGPTFMPMYVHLHNQYFNEKNLIGYLTVWPLKKWQSCLWYIILLSQWWPKYITGIWENVYTIARTFAIILIFATIIDTSVAHPFAFGLMSAAWAYCVTATNYSICSSSSSWSCLMMTSKHSCLKVVYTCIPYHKL